VKGVPVLRLLQDCDPSWRLIVVGDALMSPWELQSSGSRWSYRDDSGAPGIAWLVWLAEHFRHAAWLNPEPQAAWYGTAEVIRRVFPMYRLTQDGCSRRCATSCAAGPTADVRQETEAFSARSDPR